MDIANTYKAASWWVSLGGIGGNFGQQVIIHCNNPVNTHTTTCFIHATTMWTLLPTTCFLTYHMYGHSKYLQSSILVGVPWWYWWQFWPTSYHTCNNPVNTHTTTCFIHATTMWTLVPTTCFLTYHMYGHSKYLESSILVAVPWWYWGQFWPTGYHACNNPVNTRTTTCF
jgi:hypothetical protein